MTYEKEYFQNKISDGMVLILEGLGEDLNRQGLLRTPMRFAKACEEWFDGYNYSEDAVKLMLTRQFDESEKYDELIIEKDIEFMSHCEHHFAPFFGKVHIGYLPKNGRVVGLSKLARVVNIYSRRLQLQERMTQQIAEALWKYIDIEGCIVVSANVHHVCMSTRGVKNHSANCTMSAVRGVFKEQKHPIRMEFYAALKL